MLSWSMFLRVIYGSICRFGGFLGWNIVIILVIISKSSFFLRIWYFVFIRWFEVWNILFLRRCGI